MKKSALMFSVRLKSKEKAKLFRQRLFDNDTGFTEWVNPKIDEFLRDTGGDDTKENHDDLKIAGDKEIEDNEEKS